jgi:phosphate transport system substrate-binding protein
MRPELRSLLLPTLLLAVAAGAGCSKRKDGAGGGEAAGSGTASGTGSGSVAAPATGGGIVKVDGSSTVFPLSEAVAEDFRGKGDATVAASGTGGGFKKFCRGEIDVTGASRPIKDGEVEACKAGGVEFVELPVAYDGLAVVVHPSNDFVDHLTVAELKKIWEPEAAEKVTRWSQVREGWPDRELVLFGAGADSGTYDYFTQAIVGKEHSSRGDYTSNEDDNVLVTGVAGNAGALGFFGFAYYTENKAKLKVVRVDDGDPANGAGPIEPTVATVADGTYQPLSRPLFVYVSVKALERASVASFASYYLERAAALAGEVGYIPLPPRAYELARARLTEKKPGSVFAGKGSQVGVTVEKLLEAEGR